MGSGAMMKGPKELRTAASDWGSGRGRVRSGGSGVTPGHRDQ